MNSLVDPDAHPCVAAAVEGHGRCLEEATVMCESVLVRVEAAVEGSKVRAMRAESQQAGERELRKRLEAGVLQERDRILDLAGDLQTMLRKHASTPAIFSFGTPLQEGLNATPDSTPDASGVVKCSAAVTTCSTPMQALAGDQNQNPSTQDPINDVRQADGTSSVGHGADFTDAHIATQGDSAKAPVAGCSPWQVYLRDGSPTNDPMRAIDEMKDAVASCEATVAPLREAISGLLHQCRTVGGKSQPASLCGGSSLLQSTPCKHSATSVTPMRPRKSPRDAGDPSSSLFASAGGAADSAGGAADSAAAVLPLATAAWEDNTDTCGRCGVGIGKRRLRLRHHCRMCGKCVCARCAPNFVTLGTQGQESVPAPQRVCTHCVQTLRQVFPTCPTAPLEPPEPRPSLEALRASGL